MQQINHYTIAKKTGLHSLCLRGFPSIFHARSHRKNERNPVHSFHGLVHSFLRRCWFISQDWRLFRKIFAFFASNSAIIFDGLALGWYAQFAADAEEEGFTSLAAQFRAVGKIEKSHEERYLKLLDNVEMKKVFEKSEEVMWVCRNCGHIVIGKKAPAVCPVCAHPQSYFEVKAENY